MADVARIVGIYQYMVMKRFERPAPRMAGKIALYHGAVAVGWRRDVQGDPVEIVLASVVHVALAKLQVGIPEVIENCSGDIAMSPEQFFRLCVELSVKPRCQFVVKTHYTVVRRGHFRFLGMMFILYCAWKRKNLGSVLTYLTVRPCALTAYCTELS